MQIGPYLLFNRLGEGSAGQVYRAQDVRQGRTIALKIMHDRAGVADEWHRELRASLRLNHPHIGRVERCEVLPDGRLAVIMPFYEGRSLDRLLLPLDPAWALNMALQLAGALAHAHERGVIHCDLKPSNILWSASGVRVLDFGLSFGTGERVAREQPTLGATEYRAPEQLNARSQPHTSSDLWSVGVMLYELLSGYSPFRRATERATRQAVLLEQPTPLVRLAPHLAPELTALIERLLTKKASLRPTAQGLLEAFNHLCENKIDDPFSLLEPLPLLLGRSEALTQLRMYLTDPACRLVVVQGLAGVGKTALIGVALQEARRAGWFVSTVTLNDSDLQTASLHQLAQQHLGSPDALPGPTLLHVDSRTLNEKDFAAMEGVLRDFQKVTLLVSTRSPVHSAEAWVLPLGGLRLPEGDQTEQEQRTAAPLRLYLSAAPDNLQDDFSTAEVLALCRALCGHPLGLLLCAQQAAKWPPKQLTSHLLAGLPLTQTPLAPLAQALQEGVNTLDQSSRQLLARLPVMHGPFTSVAAQVVLEAAPRALHDLHAQAWLSMTLDGRYAAPAFLGSMMAFLSDQTQPPQSDFLQAWRERHVRHYLKELRALSPAFKTAQRTAALQQLDEQFGNYQAAVSDLTSLDAELGEPLRSYWTQKGQFEAGYALFSQLAGPFSQVSAAWFALLLGRRDESSRLLPPDVPDRLRDTPTQLIELNTRAGLYWAGGELQQARELTAQVQQRAQQLGDLHTLASSTANLALLDEAAGDLSASKQHYQQSITLAESAQNWGQVAVGLSNLAALHLGLGEVREATPLLKRGLALAARHHLTRAKPILHSNYGLCLYEDGEYGFAVEAHRDALEALKLRGEILAALTVQTYLAQALGGTGQRRQAGQLLMDSLTQIPSETVPEAVLAGLVRVADWMSADSVDADHKGAQALAMFVFHHPDTEAADRHQAQRLAQRLSRSTATQTMPQTTPFSTLENAQQAAMSSLKAFLSLPEGAM